MAARFYCHLFRWEMKSSLLLGVIMCSDILNNLNNSASENLRPHQYS